MQEDVLPSLYILNDSFICQGCQMGIVIGYLELFMFPKL